MMGVLTAPEARIARAIGQAMFPREARGLPDGHDAHVVDYLDKLLALALPFERTQLRGLFQLFERSFMALHRQSLADADADVIAEFLRGWEESPTYSRRMIFEGLRSIYLMAWFGSDRVNAEVGVTAAPDPDAPMEFLRRVAAGVDEVRAAEEIRALPAPPRPNRFMGRPEGLFEYGDYRGDIRDNCDVVVVGSGPGGVIAALEMARAGRRVILVEAGPVARRADLSRDGGMTMTRLLWDSGMRTTRGNIIAPTMQARVLGGGTVINSAICLRATDAALESWAEDHGVEGLLGADLAPHFDAVEAFMGVRVVEDAVLGPRNRLFAEGAAAVGLQATPILRNEQGCLGSGGCLYGCRNGAKLSHDRRGVPELIEAGGRVYTSVQCDRVILRDGRAAGIEGFVVHPSTGQRSHTVRILARAVVLAAGVIATPTICQRSGLTRPAIGANLRMHPGTVVAGDFPEPVHPWSGATQGMHVLDLLPYGIKLEALWADPALMAFRMPGFGRPLKRALARYRHIATWDAWVSGDDSGGHVRQRRGAARPSIHYDLGMADLRRLQQATATLCEMFFAAGATKVYPGIHGLPPTLRGPDEVATLRTARIDVHAVPSGSNHIFGTMAMGADPDRSATASDGSVHGVDDLYVTDASLFPSTPGVNPMLTIWALAHKIGREIARRY
ncbi:MAG: FAD-binding protein [Deltaproteobacteria bacterium]|nr:MAG: FAD-binding protein [Deltaproteobacteria bacterium]